MSFDFELGNYHGDLDFIRVGGCVTMHTRLVYAQSEISFLEQLLSTKVLQIVLGDFTFACQSNASYVPIKMSKISGTKWQFRMSHVAAI